MFQSSTQTRSGGVQEDALIVMAALVAVLGDGFIKYMDAFKPYWLGLKNTVRVSGMTPSTGIMVTEYTDKSRCVTLLWGL